MTQVAVVRKRATRRRRVVLLLASLLLIGLFLLRSLVGDYSISFLDAIAILRGVDLGVPNFIFLQVKLPTALLGVAAGLALGISGAAFQSMLRNPLASPDVLGVTLGASAAAVGGGVFFGLTSQQATMAAFGGGLAVALSIYWMAGGASAISNRIILLGIAISAAMRAIIHWALLTGNTYQARDAMVWLSGSLNAATWEGVARAWAVVAIGLPLLLLLAGPLRAIEAGDDFAGGLGVNVSRVRLAVMLLVVLLTATITSVVGPIAFVGLLAGPIARVCNAGRTSLPLAALIGATIVVGADFAGENLSLVGPLPVGVITGALGAPMLVLLLVGAGKKEKTHG